MKRTNYSKKLKESVFKRLAPPNAEKVPALAKELNIPKPTLYSWRTKVLKESSTLSKKANKWTSEDKFQAVLETSSLSELETSKYCRKKANAILGGPRGTLISNSNRIKAVKLINEARKTRNTKFFFKPKSK